MDSGETQYLYKETRLNLEPPASSSLVTIRVPAASHLGRSHHKITRDDSVEDETTFRLKNLATASSIYHRQWNSSPRSFLWRVLEEGTILSIRAVDVCKKAQAADAPLVLNFVFSVPIQPGCVAFSDPEEHDSLLVFVLDQANQLYQFTLRPEFFRKRSAIDTGLLELAKVQSPAGLGFKTAHRMVAVTAETLLVTVNDGGMIRLDKNKEHQTDSRIWNESFFNVQGWAQNLRSLLPFQGKHTIKYGRVNMEYSAATAVEITSFGLPDALFAITVCLDHRMRIWNIQDGRIVYTGDILNAERNPQEIGKWAIDPSHSNLVRVVGRSPGQRICATFSPIGAGEFKFWKMTAKDAHTLIVEDVFPQNALVPVTPSSSDVWTLADFVLSSPLESGLQLWTLWKNNMTYRVQRLEVDRKDITNSWDYNWTGVHVDSPSLAAETSGPCDPTDVTEKWLQLILKPGRFTRATLETALSIYERGLGTTKESSKGRGLAESICSVLGSTATLDRGAAGAMDYEQFRASSETQWKRFYRLLMELDKQRGEAIGLVLDGSSEMTWVVCADSLSAIRDCSSIERLYHNLAVPETDRIREATLVNSALVFVEGFPDNLVQLCQAALRSELFQDSAKTELERIQYFSDKSGFWRGITDEDCNQVVDALGQNFSLVTDDLYADIFGLVAAPVCAKSRNLRPLTEFGRKLVVQAVQETLAVQWKVCFSQLILLVHMEFEFDQEADALHNRLEIGTVYRQLITALRRLELLKWLGKTEISGVVVREKGETTGISKKGPDDVQVVTALEANLGHLLGVAVKNEPLASSITDLIANLCAPDSDIEVSPALIQCSLIKRERADLALDLAPFCDQNPFSVYVQGRVSLALKDFSTAAIHFRKAAIGMSTENVEIDRHSSGLLDDTEWNLLNSGLAKYYSHIVALYEKQKAYSFVVEFARLAMQFLGFKQDAALTKTEMQSRLFNAAVATSQFDLAHTTLLSIKDSALRHSSLRKLVDKMCETYHNLELVALPFPGMQQDVDNLLSQRSKATMDIVDGFPYHQVLYSWRIKHNNYRGAATVLLDRIKKLRSAGEGDEVMGDDILDTPITRQYLLLINALSCVELKQAWIYDEPTDAVGKRKVVSLADIRKQYQDELDRIAAIHNNQFGFEVDDVMEIV
ncbi:nucleoporin Nup120/160-domain-containing protein [Thelonectria olida]|uniref:Nucleoporin Nup120/160-domain-containing protein n=1 Tax=Thelonectria olida TaxID=1576542 RepID=A0A9P8WKB6_9HYPO|nr:nucleoporin Nup120/160-domain-containing protein [Thelonectria olida]